MRRVDNRGFTLVEVVFAASLLTIAMLGLFASITASMQSSGVAKERAAALRAASEQLEDLKSRLTSAAFSTVTSRCFVASIEVGGRMQAMKTQSGDPDGVTGFVWFPGDDSSKVSAEDRRRALGSRPRLYPVPTGGGWTSSNPASGSLGDLREDVPYLPLGLPRDLNTDGTIEAVDVAATAAVLPVVVGVEWRGVAGNMSVVIQTTLKK